MELGGGGESAARSVRLSSNDAAAATAAGEDRFSTLPDDVLVLILLKLSPRDAAQTRVLSHRWRRIWPLLPVLCFFRPPEPHRLRDLLDAHEVLVRNLFVVAHDATPESLAVWLPAAARRVSGQLDLIRFSNAPVKDDDGEEAAQSDDEEGPVQSGVFELPCLERATKVKVSLLLASLGLAVPPAGVFARLTDMCLYGVRLHGPGDLGDAVSWPRCPCLQKLTFRHARGLDNLTIQSYSLRQVELTVVQGLQQLNIVAPALEELKVERCFLYSLNQPVASITAPQLANLRWIDAYDPSSVHLGEMRHLRLLRPLFFLVYPDDSYTHNQSCLSLLQRFKVIEHLILTLTYLGDLDDCQYVMEDMSMLPSITILHLNIASNKHAFRASAFHVLRMCSGIRKLMLAFQDPTLALAQPTCPQGCICGEHQNWESEHLVLKHLKEVEITYMRESEHEVAFVKQLFIWGTALEKIMVFFDISVTESVAKELSQVLRSFARPEIRMEIHTFRDMLLMVPED